MCRKFTSFKPGEVLVTNRTDPDWEPIMKRASAIVTNSRRAEPAMRQLLLEKWEFRQ